MDCKVKELNIMFLVDSHCHIDCLDYISLHKNMNDALTKAKERDIGYVLAVSTTLTAYQTISKLLGTRDDVAFSCGIHPLHLDDTYNYAALRHLAAEEQVVALGETGLDYFYKKNNIALQKAAFREHIRISRDLDKPLIVHTRNAVTDTLAILCEEKIKDYSGVLHCFTEDRATAALLLDLGFYISFSGIVTFRNAEQLREVARYVPLDRLLLETDSPYLTPVPHRGKENQPSYLRDIAKYMAELKRISLENLAQATTENFARLFRIKF